MKNVVKALTIPASALALMVALVACGNEAAAPEGSSSDGATGAPSAPPITENPVFPDKPSAADLPQGQNVVALRASIAETSNAEPKEVVLVCEGGAAQAMSTVSNAESLCGNLPDSWERVLTGEATRNPNVNCTTQYGGPSVAVVVGTYNGKTVDQTFSRGDGCEIAKWNALEPLLGKGASPVN
ncbi:hypothetical protein [Haematomicrobium sanguinis]|uniref:hypothetical protein n=1 Tax=Haematomicrobium sanguinis TaxID=479106 RepID=UPI00047B8AE0|nr:hypothetical protein [Haematomicrobium sanguinis]